MFFMSRQEYATSYRSFPAPDPASSVTAILPKEIRHGGETFKLEKRDREKIMYRSDKGRFFVSQRTYTKADRRGDFLWRERLAEKPAYFGNDKELAELHYRRLSL